MPPTYSALGNRQTEIQDWNELIAELVKIQTQMLNQKQNSKELQFPPSLKCLHNFNFRTFNKCHCHVCDIDFVFFPPKKCLGNSIMQVRPNESEGEHQSLKQAME